jgi:hypothetical protein
MTWTRGDNVKLKRRLAGGDAEIARPSSASRSPIGPASKRRVGGNFHCATWPYPLKMNSGLYSCEMEVEQSGYSHQARGNPG